MSRQGAAMMLALVQGFGSMGFQLVGSRLLAPYFGTTLVVWAILISTFLASFSAGAFVGGAISRLPSRTMKGASQKLAMIGVLCYLIPALAGHPIARFISDAAEDAWAGILATCMGLFFLPALTLSSVLPILTEEIGRTGAGAGLSSGRVYGMSTLGNILGVLITAFILVPNFGTSQLLWAWAAMAACCFSLLLAVVSRSDPHHVGAPNGPVV